MRRFAALLFVTMLCGASSACAGDPFVGLTSIEEEPVQTDLDPWPSWEHRGHILEAVAEYEIEAVVLHRRPYNFGRFSRLSPIDIALGWGVMSDPEVLTRLELRQHNRFYHFRWRDPPPTEIRAMEKQSANVHMIPADRPTRRALFGLRQGDVVQLRGRLVDVHA